MNLKTVFLVFLALIQIGQTARADETWKPRPAVKEKCLKVLHEGLQSDEFWPSIHAAEALTQAGYGEQVRESLATKIASESDDQRRCGLAREMYRAGDRSADSILLEILRGSDPHGHVHAAESLYKVGWRGDNAPLHQAFVKSADIRLRLMAAAALAKYGEDEIKTQSFAFLRQNLRDEPDPAVFRLSAWVLARIGNDTDRPLIRSRLDDAGNDVVVRAFLEHALAALGDPRGRKALIDNLSSKDPAVRTYAAVFAGETANMTAAPFLVRQLDDDNLDSRIRAAQAILLLSR